MDTNRYRVQGPRYKVQGVLRVREKGQRLKVKAKGERKGRCVPAS